MNYQSTSFAAALQDAKNAALYFDYVLPVNFAEVMPEAGEFHYSDVLKSLLPPALLSRDTPVGLRTEVTGCLAKFIVMFPEGFIDHEWAPGELDARRSKHMGPFLTDIATLVSQADQPLTDLVIGPQDEHAATVDDASPALTLSNIALVNVSGVSWPHLLEFRKDDKSRRSLRRLRMFVYENYDGKSPSFISDDLAFRIREYEETARQWGFATKISSLKALVDSKTTLATLTAMVGALFGAPLPIVLASAAAGMALDIAGVSLSLAERRHSVDALRASSPVAYLILLCHIAERR